MLDIVPAVSIKDLHTRLGFSNKIKYRKSLLKKPLTEFEMEKDDVNIIRYLFSNFPIRRHLEFGTWQGMGVLKCLEESNATVWTINLLDGEKRADGNMAYSECLSDNQNLPAWSVKNKSANEQDGQVSEYQTDSLGFIGRYYLEKKLGSRVCQIYCDSRDWDISNYPEGFFDSVLIDGGHDENVIINDTRKAFKLLRPGGIIIWHDFCPDKEVLAQCSSTRGIFDAISYNIDEIKENMRDLFWIKPSWILFGIYGKSSDKQIHQFTGTEIISQKEDIIEKNKKIETLENIHEISQKQLKESNNKFKSLINNLNKKEEIHTQLQKELLNMNRRIESLNSELVKKEQTIGSLKTETDVKESRIESLQKEISDKSEKIDSLNIELRKKDQTINSIQIEVVKRESTIENMQTELIDKENQIKIFNKELKNKENNINFLQSMVSEKDGEITNSQSVISEKENEINNLQSMVSEKDGEISSSQSVISEKENEINNLQSVISEKENEINSLQSELGRIKSKIWYRAITKILQS